MGCQLFFWFIKTVDKTIKITTTTTTKKKWEIEVTIYVLADSAKFANRCSCVDERRTINWNKCSANEPDFEYNDNQALRRTWLFREEWGRRGHEAERI